MLAVTLAAGLWPFGGEDRRDPEATIGALRSKPPALELRAEVPDSAALAREHYRDFLALPGVPTDMRAEAMRRLADLYLAAGEAADAQGDAPGSEAAYRQAIGLYNGYLAEFPGRPETDHVLYTLSRAHESIGEAQAALAILDELVGRFPQSTFFAEAQFRRGERLFMLRRYDAADRAYAAVLALGPDSGFYEQSLYKHGWSLFKLGDYAACLDPFLDLLRRRVPQGTTVEQVLDGLGRPERELAEDALRAMSLAISQLDGIRSVDALLDRRAPVAFADLVYGALGDFYMAQERYSDAAEAYGGFVKRDPTHPRAPYLQAQVIRAWTAAKFPSRVLEAKAQYVELYGFHSAYWSTQSPAERPLVVQHLKQSLSDLASHDHEQAQRQRTAEAYQRAAQWYRRYLEYFPEDVESAQRNFLLAELLFEAGDYAAATREYRRTAYDYAVHPQAAEAAYAAVLASRRHEATLTGETVRAAWHAAGIEDALRFAAAFPSHPQAPAVQTDVAEQLFREGQLPRAIAVAAEVVARIPPATPALDRVAWAVIAHAQFDLGRYAEAEQAYRRLRGYGEQDPARRAEIEERIAAAVYRQAEAQKAAGNTEAAVAEFLRVAEAAPAAAIRPHALYDAAALLMSEKQWDQSVAILQRFRRDFPEHEFNNEVTQKLAVALMESGRNAEAAAEFEAVAQIAALDPAIHREALWQAAELYAKAGRSHDERRIYAAIVGRFPEPFAEAMEARQKLADLARDGADAAERRRWLAEIIAADDTAGAARTERSRYLAAHAALELAAPLRDAFVATPLTVPLKKSLQAKKARMELALSAYGRAAQYDVAEVTTAATHETAELYFRLGQDLLASERPTELTAEELDEYQLLLEEQAFPFEEKAIELHALNAQRAAEGLYDEWVRKSFARLAELNPARYARAERSEAYVAALD